MPNALINAKIEKAIKPAIKVSERNCKDDLIFGVVVITMEKEILQSNPISSYIYIIVSEICATYSSQKFTCKYCNDLSKKQRVCEECAFDFPFLCNTTAKTSNTVVALFK